MAKYWTNKYKANTHRLTPGDKTKFDAKIKADVRHLGGRNISAEALQRDIEALYNSRPWIYDDDPNCGLSKKKLYTYAVVLAAISGFAFGYAIPHMMDHNKVDYKISPTKITYKEPITPVNKTIDYQIDGSTDSQINNGTINGHFDNAQIKAALKDASMSGIYKGWSNATYNGTVTNCSGDLYLDNVQLNGMMKGKVTNLTLDNVQVDASLTARLDCTIDNGTADGTLQNMKINGFMDGKVTNLSVNASIDALLDASMNGAYKGKLVNTTLDGTYDGKLKNATINGTYKGKVNATNMTGNITMSGAEFKRFYQNATFSGQIVMHYGNGDVGGDLNGTVDLSKISDTETIKMVLKNATIQSTDMAGTLEALLDAEMNGTVKAKIDGESEGTIIGKVLGSVKGWLKGNVTDGDYYGKFNGTATGNVSLKNLKAHLYGFLKDGKVKGPITGRILDGDYYGEWHGKATGNVKLTKLDGDIYGRIKGYSVGEFHGTATGKVEGTMTGDIDGSITGRIIGKLKAIGHMIVPQSYVEKKESTWVPAAEAGIIAFLASLAGGKVVRDTRIHRKIVENRQRELAGEGDAGIETASPEEQAPRQTPGDRVRDAGLPVAQPVAAGTPATTGTQPGTNEEDEEL